MQNLYLYYKYIIRVQFLLKYPIYQKNNSIVKIFLKKILLEVYLKNLNSNYYIYLYNISILIRLIINKFLYVKKVKKKFSINKIYLGVALSKEHMYSFIDIFANLLLPLFESFNIYLDVNKFDALGNLTYKLIYFDPVFMSKNTIIAWSKSSNINIKFCNSTSNKYLNFNLLQYLKLKCWL